MNRKTTHLFALSPAWVLFLVFLFINLVQSYFTPLINDEPYYWLWSQQVALGYFDHPPLIAWLIGAGNLLFHNELGVRIFTALSGSFTLLFLYKIIEAETSKPVNWKLVALLAGSSVFFNLYSFMAIPDTPLLFFTTLFLWQFRRYLNNDNTANSIALGLICALLLYAKYHGILVIGLTVLANIKLLKKRSFYLVFITTTILFIPHIWWQFTNNFPTLRFHFIENLSEFNFKNVFSYLGEQLALTGPVVLLLSTLFYKTQNPFQRTLKVVSLGIFAFFLISSFRGMINAYWTLAAWPGLIVIAYLQLTEKKKAQKLAVPFLLISLAFVIFIRINFLFNLFPIPNFNNRNPQKMVSTLKKASNKPLVFVNSFIDPSLFLFYGNEKDTCYAINNSNYKKTQFNYMAKQEAQIQGKDVVLVTNYAINNESKLVKIEKGRQYYLSEYPNFKSFQTTAHIDYFLQEKRYKVGSKISFPIVLNNTINNSQHDSIQQINIIFNMKLEKNGDLYTCTKKYQLNSNKETNFDLSMPNEPGLYKCFFSVTSKANLNFMNTYNSHIVYFEVQ